ncbi:hypothetical protein O181_025731 [Austropuccinia psidii MF-1]|uniref:Uncharacterized protein n=1 Tax=Austropuccinia psidii MF-1 TaxID=1389203 RepID=A0A9Q3CJ53_9BASI|nr:hypothetical protein [Austropuccinia psidii MF-1]
MEGTIWLNHMVLEKEEVRPGPRPLPTTFDIYSDPKLIQDNVSMVEPQPSDRYRNISVSVQSFVQRSKGCGVGNIPKLLIEGYELLHLHQEISGSREDHRALRRLKPISLQ